MRRTIRLRGGAVWGLGLVLGAGCIEFERGEGESTGGGAGSEGESTGVPTSGADTAPTGESGDEATGGGIGGECDLWVQDCLDDSKCMPVDSDADGIQDATKCVPLSANPKQAGDDCKVEGSPASGVDDCGEGLICWGVDKQSEGKCVQMCEGSQWAPTCPDGLICDVSNGGALPLCLAPCDPLTPSCGAGKVCIFTSTGDGIFVCDTDASGEGGYYGDDCEYINVCDDGLLCAPAAAVPGCLTPGCCTEYCDLDEADNLCSGAPSQQCLPFYDNSEPPPGFEDVGVCTIPM